MVRSGRWLLLSFLASVSGCARLTAVTAARLMVVAPNTIDPRIGLENEAPLHWRGDGFDHRFWVPVGPPRAHLLVSLVEPRPRGRRPAGTVVLLHGAYGRSEEMLAPASALARAGYRAVLMDLRGHGRSSGQRITWGAREAIDVEQVIQALDRHGLLIEPLGVYGYSFGAATGLRLAATDRRVRAVVAVAPYRSLRDATRHVILTRLPAAPLLVDDGWMEQAVREAGELARFDPRSADTLAAVQRTGAHVLLVHGDADELVPPSHSVALGRAAGGRAQVVFLRGADHHDVVEREARTVIQLALRWFRRWMEPTTLARAPAR